MSQTDPTSRAHLEHTNGRVHHLQHVHGLVVDVAMTEVSRWTCEDVAQWLEVHGFSQYRRLLCDEHRIDGGALLSLTEDDLKRPPLSISVLGDVKRLASAISRLHAEDMPLQINHSSNGHVGNGIAHNLNNSPLSDRTCYSPFLDSENSDLEYTKSNIRTEHPEQNKFSHSLEREYWKTFLSLVIWISVSVVTSVVLVIAHDRVPDRQKHPPLPDVVLDNVKRMPWAFEGSEIILLILLYTGAAVVCLHKHRLIIIRRLSTLWGTIFLLRSFSMLITSLSVPALHLECSEKTDGSLGMVLRRGVVVWLQGGMRIQGVRTCGDLFFSGHTTTMTLMNYFISEYTPKQGMFRLLHVVTWLLNFLGMFLILAGHGHYSIDVFIAFYLTSILFLYYHALANSRYQMQRDITRSRIWFPFLEFFESKCDGMVPNEYEWPLPNNLKQCLHRKIKKIAGIFKVPATYMFDPEKAQFQ